MNQPLEIADFSGGKTDNYLSGPLNCGQIFDNLLINKNRKPFCRPGSDIENISLSQIPSGDKRISYLWNHRDQNLEQSERHIFYKSGGLYNELLGPTGNRAFDDGSTTSHVSGAFWNNHSLFVIDNFTSPIKVFKNASNVMTLLAAGLPDLATAPTVTKGGAGAGSYIYAFLYYNSYNVEGVTFEDFGPTTQVQITSSTAPDVNTVAITNIPILANTTIGNYATATIKVKIYRTEVNQTVLKFIGEVTNGTTTYSDSASDSSITNNVTIYTNGGVVDNDPPPPAKFVHVTNNIALYGYVKENGINMPNRVRQSLSGDIDSCPVDFTDDFSDELMGINSIQSTFIVFCADSTFRTDGFFDEQGRGGMVHQKISSTYGCVSNDSIVQVDDGLIFASKQGWCFTDGYSVKKISDHLNDTYKTLVASTSQARNIVGTYDKKEKRVWFATQSGSDALDNDSSYILDLNFGIREESTFTTASNGDSFAPSFLMFKNGNLYRADTRGYVFLHNDLTYSDPKVNFFVSPSTWARKTIIYDYTSVAFNFGSSFIRKFVPKMSAIFANITNMDVQINSINDDGKSATSLKEIRFESNILWGDPDIIWGTSGIIWNKRGLIDELRHFVASTLRCNYKQIQITNSYTVITNSDAIGTSTVNSTTKVVTLDTVGSTWPTTSVDYYVSFANDSYTNEFLVTAVSGNTITYFDPTNIGPANGSYKWLLKGLRKNVFLEIISYVIHYKMLSSSMKPYHSATDSGANS